jgi:pimeloyl-ACP methyl ester carboxylesterase
MKRIVVILMGALSFVLGAASCASVRPVAAQPVALSDERMLPYASPGLLIDIGGRQINLHCMGAGEPTVILMSGIASWSPIWYKVQPEIAARTRVCTFDRAGYGFSDPAPRPQVLSDAADDLHAALAASALRAPYVLVGHSMGGVEARLYAQRWPSEVAGMVLVDTSPAGEGLINEQQPGFDEAMGREYYASNKLHCALLAAWTVAGVQPGLWRLCAAPAGRCAGCTAGGVAPFLHRLLCGHASVAHDVALHAPLRQRRSQPSRRHPARRVVAGANMESRHA